MRRMPSRCCRCGRQLSAGAALLQLVLTLRVPTSQQCPCNSGRGDPGDGDVRLPAGGGGAAGGLTESAVRSEAVQHNLLAFRRRCLLRLRLLALQRTITRLCVLAPYRD